MMQDKHDVQNMQENKNAKVIRNFWDEIHQQNWDKLSQYFFENAVINWNNTNEQFTVEEFIIANKEYPGDWTIELERLEAINELVISVVKVQLKEGGATFHATSFFEFQAGKIKLLNEYWGDDGNAPQWRIDRKIGKSTK
jgi:hypothetical protein